MKDIRSLISKQIFRISILGILYSLVFPVCSVSQSLCEKSFTKTANTRYEAQKKSVRFNDSRFHSDYINLKRDLELELLWNKPPENIPSFVQKVVPAEVFPINHSQEYSPYPYLVRMEQYGSSIIARTSYTYKGIVRFTNVLFGINSIKEYIQSIINPKGQQQHISPPKYLVEQSARAAVVYFHGGGTRTTGSSVFAANLSKLEKYGIAVLAIDLPMHAKGPRKPFPDIQEEIRALGSLVKKYIPKDIPVFVYGHSFGAIFADQLMRMTEEGVDFFHPSLKGVLIGSPPVDMAPGKSPSEKIEAFIEYQKELRKKNENLPINSAERTWTNMVAKISFIAEFYLGYITSQYDQSVPTHKGAGYKVKGKVISGKHDDLVFNEKAFGRVYGSMKHIVTHYFDKLFNIMTGDLEKVGHLLGNYSQDKETGIPLDVEIIVRSVSEELNMTPKSLLQRAKQLVQSDSTTNTAPWALMVQEWYNNFSARDWFKEYTGYDSREDGFHKGKLSQELGKNYKKALRLYEENFPENRLISLLKKVILTQPNENFQELQQQLTELRSNNYFSSSSLSRVSKIRESLLELEGVSDLEEAKQLSRVILQKYFPKYFQYTTIDNIIDSIRSNKELPQDFDIFPFNQDQARTVPDYSILHLPPHIKSYMLELVKRYRNEKNRFRGKELLKEIRYILTEYDPHMVLFRVLEHFPTVSDLELRKKSLPVLKSYQEQLSQFENYKNLNKDLKSLLKTRHFSNMVKKALTMIHNFSPIVSDSYFMEKLERRVHNPNSLHQDVILELNLFELPENVRDQIVNILKPLDAVKQLAKDMDQKVVVPKEEEDVYRALRESSGTAYDEIKDIITVHNPIHQVYGLIQFLRRMVSKHTLEKFIEYFPEYPLFNEQARKQYFDGLKNSQILQKVLSGDISAKDVWNRRYYPFSSARRASKANSLVQVFKGEKDIDIVLDQVSMPKDIRKQIERLYKRYQVLSEFDQGKHIPSLEDFSRNLHDGKELTKEQEERYSPRIGKIKRIVKNLKELRARKKILIKRQSKLKELLYNPPGKNSIKGLSENIDKAKHLVQNAFRDAQGNPPESMAKEYKELYENYYRPLEKHVYKTIDVMYRHAARLGERRHVLNFDQFQVEFLQASQAKEIQTLSKEHQDLLSVWQEKRNSLTEKLIPALLKGEMGDSLQEQAVLLFGSRMEDSASNSNSRYSELKSTKRELAEVESELLRVEKANGEMLQDYDQSYPFYNLTVLDTVQSNDLLNPDLSTYTLSDYLEDNAHEVHFLWESYKNLDAHPVPSLPSLD